VFVQIFDIETDADTDTDTAATIAKLACGGF
jgi:hypothetical protein